MSHNNTPPDIQSAYQQQLEASERRFRSLVRNGSDLMTILDSAANYIYVTDPNKRVLGYSAGNFIGKNAYDYIHPDDLAMIQEVIMRLEPGATTEFPAYRFRAADDEWKWLETKMTNLVNDPAVGGFVANSRDVTERRKLDAERIHEAERRQRQITHAIMQAQEKERFAIGNELHDNVNQMLTTVKLYLVMARDSAGSREDLLPKAIDYIQDCINEIRKLTNRLVSLPQSDVDLNDALKDLIDSIALAGSFQLNFHPIETKNLKIGEEVQLAIYRIVQEQLTNIIRHANAMTVDISLFTEDDIIHLTITDDGQGFDIHQKKRGVGLTNMANRAEAVGGMLDVSSSPGEGTTLSAGFPIKPA